MRGFHCVFCFSSFDFTNQRSVFSFVPKEVPSFFFYFYFLKNAKIIIGSKFSKFNNNFQWHVKNLKLVYIKITYFIINVNLVLGTKITRLLIRQFQCHVASIQMPYSRVSHVKMSRSLKK
jgi:hypothetical protein